MNDREKRRERARDNRAGYDDDDDVTMHEYIKLH